MDSYAQHPLFQACGVIGLLYISYKIASFIQLLASTFALPGIPVSDP
jgi:hypothetical protein